MKSEIGQSKMFGMGTAWNNGNKKTNKNVCSQYKSEVSVIVYIKQLTSDCSNKNVADLTLSASLHKVWHIF